MAASNLLWRNSNYMLLWSGQVTSTLGRATASIAYPLLILALTGLPVAAGIAGALRSAPYLLFSLPFGALIDRWDRRLVMVLCDVGRGAAVLTIPLALALDVLTVWQIYAVALIEGILFVLFNIAEVAALPRVVPAKQLSQAAGQNEAAYGVAFAAGPSLGTFLYQTLGRGAPFVADAICYLVSVVSLLLIRTPFHTKRPTTKRDLRAEIAEGVRWLWRKPLIRSLAFLTGGQNMVVTALPLICIVLASELGASTAEIGLLFTVGGVGRIVGSVVAPMLQRRLSFSLAILAGLVFHTDRGIEYAAYGFRARLARLGFVQSMNRPQQMNDNGHMESFFHSMKADAIHGIRFSRIEDLKNTVRNYIAFYNETRLHSSLNYVPPATFEKQLASPRCQ